MNESNLDVTIIGGGIIGLTIAFKLAYHLHDFDSHDSELKFFSTRLSKIRKKKSSHSSSTSVDWNTNPPLKIIVLDEHNFTSSASYQSTGILATYGATHYLSPLRRHIVESTRLYPHILSQLEEVLGKELLQAGTTVTDYTLYRPTPHYHLYDDNNILHAETKTRKLRRLTREHATEWEECTNLPHTLHMFLPQTSKIGIAAKDSFYFSTASGTSALSFASHTISPPRLLELLIRAGKKLGVEYLHGKLKCLEIPSKTDALTITYTSLKNTTRHPIHTEVTRTTGQAVLATGNATPRILSTVIKHSHPCSYRFKLKELWGALITVRLNRPFPAFMSMLTKQGLLVNFYNKKYFWVNPYTSMNHADNNQSELLFGSLDEVRSFNTELQENNPMPGTILTEERVKTKLLYELIRAVPSFATNKNLASPYPYLKGEVSDILGNQGMPRIRQGGRLFNADKQPFLGFLQENIFLATGYYKSGLALAPLHSRLAVEMILAKRLGMKKSTHQYSEEVDFLSPIRERGIEIITNTP